MAQTESARAEAFAKQADRSRELAQGYVQQAIANAGAIRQMKAIVEAALAAVSIPHRWNGPSLELLSPTTGEWVSGPDLTGPPGVTVATAEVVDGHLILVMTDNSEIDAGPVIGPTGPSGTMEIGTVTTLSPGASATVTNVGTTIAAVLNIGIPRGAAGENVQDFVNAAASKTTPVNADTLLLGDSAASGTVKKITFTNVKTFLKAYFDGLYQPVHATLTALSTGVSVAAGVFSVIGTSAAGASIRLPEDTDNGSNYVGLKAPDTLAGNVTFTLPAADGTSGQALSTDGSGNLFFAAGGAVEVAAPSQILASPAGSVTFTGIASSGYYKHILMMENVVTNAATQTDTVSVHVSTDNGSTWKTTSGDYRNLEGTQADRTSITHTASAAGPTVPGNTAATKIGYVELEFYGLGNSVCRTVCIQSLRINGVTDVNAEGLVLRAIRTAAEADNAIRIIPVTGTLFAVGSKFTLLRVKQ